MLKLFKICLGLIGALIIIAIASVVALVTLVNPNRYKDQITQQIYNATGHQATIGNISWSIFPWIKLQINNVTLNNPTGFSSSPFITVKQATISANVMDLLERKLIVNSIDINNMQVNLIHTATNNNNWTIQSGKPTQETSPSNGTTTINKNIIKSFNINNIIISNSIINWQDTAKNQTISFKINSLNTNNVNLNGNPFPINSNFTYQTAKLIQPVNIKLSTDISVNKNTGQYNFNNLVFNLNQFKLTGKAQINQTPSLTFMANFSIPTMNLAKLFSELGYTINFKNPSALTNVGGNIALAINKNSMQINGMVLDVDDTKIKGQASLTQLQPLQGNFTLAIDQLNLDQYQVITPARANKTPSKNVTNALPAPVSIKPANTTPLPACLQKANVSGKVTVSSLQVNKIQMQQVVMPVTLKNNQIIASPLTAKFYQGTLQADIKANYNASVPVYFLSAALNNIDMNSLLQQTANFNKLSGTGQINFVVNAQGNDPNSMLNTLNGNGQIQFSNGSYTGLDIINTINSAASLFLKQAAAPNTASPSTAFTELKATFQINNGLIANNDLVLSSPVMNVTGNGTVSVVTQAIDYNLLVNLLSNKTPQLANLQKQIGGKVPVKVKGSINHPKVSVDMDKISMAVTKQTINQNLDNINKGINKFSKDMAKTLNNMLGN